MEKRIVEFKTFERIDAGIKNAYIFEPLFEEKIKPPKLPSKTPISIPEGVEIPVISKDELSSLPNGMVVICPSKPSGVDFLTKYNAWGFVRVKQNPQYFALYVTHPQSRILYFGEVEDIIYPSDPKSPLTKEQALQYKDIETKKLVVLKPNSLKKLKEGIPRGKWWSQGLYYTTLEKLITAKVTDDLR